VDDRDATRRVAAHYSRDAEAFARYWAPYLRPKAEALLDRLPLAEARVVLDLGTGTGALLPSIRAAAPRALVVGTDLAEGMLRLARAGAPGPLALMDDQQLALLDRCADGALLSFVLHRLPDPAAALGEVARVLRPGGVVGTVTWGHGRRAEAGRVWDAILAARGVPSEPSTVDNHALVDQPAKLRALMLGAGLEPLEAWTSTYEQRYDLEGWLDFAIGSGVGRRAAPELRQEYLREARQRMAGLSPEAYVVRSEVVYAVARRRGARPLDPRANEP